MPNPFSRFDVYWTQTNKQTNTQTSKVHKDDPNSKDDISLKLTYILFREVCWKNENLPIAMFDTVACNGFNKNVFDWNRGFFLFKSLRKKGGGRGFLYL